MDVYGLLFWLIVGGVLWETLDVLAARYGG